MLIAALVWPVAAQEDEEIPGENLPTTSEPMEEPTVDEEGLSPSDQPPAEDLPSPAAESQPVVTQEPVPSITPIPTRTPTPTRVPTATREPTATRDLTPTRTPVSLSDLPDGCRNREASVQPNTVHPGRDVTYRTTGWDPGSFVTSEVTPDGISGPFGVADDSCTLRGTFYVSSFAASGRYTIRFLGTGIDGLPREGQVVVTVQSDPTPTRSR
jgi:hypothetical protein